MGGLSRRDAVKGLARVGALLAAGGFVGPRAPALAQDDPVLAGRPLVRYPEKTDLILLTSRPPQLETPMKYFDRAITPNEAFFVRHHVFPIPLEIDLATWRLRVTGRVDGGYGVEEVQISTDGGAVWRRADLGADLGRYSFREWSPGRHDDRLGPHPGEQGRRSTPDVTRPRLPPASPASLAP
jgi:hypothetical protein